MTRYPKNEKWTKLELDNISSEWQGDILADGGGLRGEVIVLKKGNVSIKWRYNFRYKGKACAIICGTYPSKPLSEIRSTRDEARKLVSEGIDPRAQRVANRIEAQIAIQETIIKAEFEKKQTVNDMFNDWLNHGVKRMDNNKGIIQSFNKHVLPVLGAKPVKELSDIEILSILRNIADSNKQRTAELIFSDLKQMFNWAELRKPWRGLLIEGNPINLVSKKDFLNNYVRERDRILSTQELKLLKDKFRDLKKETSLALWICLGTACRIGELLRAEWKHINFENREWFIPAENSKKTNAVRTNHTIYLSDFIYNKFNELKNITGDSKWLFPAKNKENTHVNEKTVSKQVGDRQYKFKQRKELTGRVNNNTLVVGDREWTPHDLRRTAATMMQQLKVPLEVIDRCQHHKLAGKIRRHYMHYEYKDEMKQAWNTLGIELAKILAD